MTVEQVFTLQSECAMLRVFIWHIELRIVSPNTHTYTHCAHLGRWKTDAHNTTRACRHTMSRLVSVGSTGRCLLAACTACTEQVMTCYKMLLDALIEMKATVLGRLRQFHLVLIMRSRCCAVLYTSRFDVMHVLITEQRRILCLLVFSIGKSLFTETLNAALGKLIDQ